MSKRVITVTVCDGCQAENLPLTAWRIARANGRIRKADLCKGCEKPLRKVLDNASATVTVSTKGTLPTATLEEIERSKSE